jgi:uncharacterized protein
MREVTAVLQRLGDVAVAVSGGVDSMTLAVVAHRTPGVRAEMFHAVSAAVPPEATERVYRYAAHEGWNLRIIDAQEFADPDYLRNPRDAVLSLQVQSLRHHRRDNRREHHLRNQYRRPR